MSMKHKANLKLRAQLLPELYVARSNYQLIVFITNFKIKKVLRELLLSENLCSACSWVLKTVGNIKKEAIKAHVGIQLQKVQIRYL